MIDSTRSNIDDFPISAVVIVLINLIIESSSPTNTVVSGELGMYVRK